MAEFYLSSLELTSLFERNKTNPRQIINPSEASNIRGITEDVTGPLGSTNTIVFINNILHRRKKFSNRRHIGHHKVRMSIRL